MTGNGKTVVQVQEVGQVQSVDPDEAAVGVVAAPTHPASGSEPPPDAAKPKAVGLLPPISEGVKVGILTVTGYFVTLAHQSGYNAVFGIPEGLIDATPQALFHSLFPMLLALATMALVLFARIAWTNDASNDSKFWKDVLGVLGFGLWGGLATLFLLPDASPQIWGFHAFLMTCPFLPFLVVDGMERFTKKPCPVASRVWLPWVGAFGFMILSYQMAFWLGAGQARNREVFPILPGSQPKVLLTIRGDTWVTAPLVGPNRIAWPLTLFKPSEGERLRVQPQAVGPLKVGTSP